MQTYFFPAGAKNLVWERDYLNRCLEESWSVKRQEVSAMILSSQIPHSVDFGTEVKIQLSGPLAQRLEKDVTIDNRGSYRIILKMSKFPTCNTWGTFKSPVPCVTHGKRISHLSLTCPMCNTWGTYKSDLNSQ